MTDSDSVFTYSGKGEAEVEVGREPQQGKSSETATPKSAKSGKTPKRGKTDKTGKTGKTDKSCKYGKRTNVAKVEKWQILNKLPMAL